MRKPLFVERFMFRVECLTFTQIRHPKPMPKSQRPLSSHPVTQQHPNRAEQEEPIREHAINLNREALVQRV